MNRHSKMLGLALCLLTISLLATSARADVTYTFTGTNNGAGEDGKSVSFTFTTSTYVTSLTSLLQSQLTSCTNCLSSSSGTAVYMEANVPGYGDGIEFNDSSNNASFFLFTAGDFGKAGTYTANGLDSTGHGTLTVSTVAVPEPSSMGMTLAGGMMLAMVGFFRRKPMAVNPIA